MRFKYRIVNTLQDAQSNFEQLEGLLTLPAWTAPTLINSWANFGGAFETAGYLKDSLGFVHLKGVIKSGTSGTVAFVLPVGYRPGATTFHPAINSALTGALVEVDVSGNATVLSAGAVTNPVGLSGVVFLAEN